MHNKVCCANCENAECGKYRGRKFITTCDGNQYFLDEVDEIDKEELYHTEHSCFVAR